MKKILLSLFIFVGLANASDGYVKLSDLDASTLEQNNFVSLDTLEENSQWVSLSSLEEDTYTILDSDIQFSANLDELTQDYIALDFYEPQNSFEEENQEYVALDEIQNEEYDIVALYEEMMLEEEQAILTMNFEF